MVHTRVGRSADPCVILGIVTPSIKLYKGWDSNILYMHPDRMSYKDNAGCIQLVTEWYRAGEVRDASERCVKAATSSMYYWAVLLN